MLGKLEELSMDPVMPVLAECVEKRDFAMMKSKAHQLKGSTGYMGASKLHYSCYHIQEQYMAGNYESMMEYYPFLIEAAIDVKIESRRIIAEQESK